MRGYSIFGFFGMNVLANTNPVGRASIAGKTGFALPLLPEKFSRKTRISGGLKGLVAKGIKRARVRRILRGMGAAGAATAATTAAVGTAAASGMAVSAAAQSSRLRRIVNSNWTLAALGAAGILVAPVIGAGVAIGYAGYKTNKHLQAKGPPTQDRLDRLKGLALEKA